MTCIDLSLSYLREPLPKGLVQELEETLPRINSYPPTDYNKLRESLAKYVNVNKTQVLVGNGADEVIDIVTRVWGERVLIPTPTYSQYEVATDRLERSGKVLINCFEDDTYSLDKLYDYATSTSLIWICNPNNPTGTFIDPEVILHLLRTTNGYIIVDECYYEYLDKTVVDLIHEFDNLVVIRSLSKNFGIAGLRLGYAISTEENISQLETKRQPFNVNTAAERVGRKVFDYLGYYRDLWKRVINERDQTVRKIRRIGLKAHNTYTNFILLEFNSDERAGKIAQELKERAIRVLSANHPMWEREFSNLPKRFMRITVGTHAEMEKLITSLQEIV